MDNYIVRAKGAGVFFGQIKEKNGKEITMINARRLYHWRGATECCQLAAEGVKNPDGCRFTMYVSEVVLLEAIEYHKCTSMAEESIKGVQVWKM